MRILECMFLDGRSVGEGLSSIGKMVFVKFTCMQNERLVHTLANGKALYVHNRCRFMGCVSYFPKHKAAYIGRNKTVFLRHWLSQEND